MTLTEFKAWFSGYTEDMDGTPSAKQWKRIKKMVADIDGNTVTERIYLDRYWPYTPRWSGPLEITCSNKTAAGSSYVWNGADTTTAMFAAGKAEALELTAN